MKLLLLIFAVIIGIGLSPVAFLLMPFMALAIIIWGFGLFVDRTSHNHKVQH